MRIMLDTNAYSAFKRGDAATIETGSILITKDARFDAVVRLVRG
ncbi:MAG: hypothetical protein WCT14_08460 [Treponemataceae bacterium]